MKKDFAERQKIKEEARLLGKESVGIDESSKLKRGDDYRGKIIHDKDRFQDKIHEKISNRNSENELTQGSSKKNAKYTKNIADNEDMSVLKENKDKIQGSPIGDYENESFKKFDENGKGDRITNPISQNIGKDSEPAFDKGKANLLKKRKMAQKLRKELRTDGVYPYNQSEEVYDPLGKDLDNDDIIDRYDNDFRDSDYFESAYDVEDNLHTK